ncbi:MAG: hypothetical protein P4L69_16860, partial [Desulfosporosinus sp.]|nr:hypothetical protein [Desulfosporosinus sp.]
FEGYVKKIKEKFCPHVSEYQIEKEIYGNAMNFILTVVQARAILVLPYSTAPVESVFSQFKTFKTPYRGGLKVETLEVSIIIEQSGEPFQIKLTIIEKYATMWRKEEEINSVEQKEVTLPELQEFQAHSQEQKPKENDPLKGSLKPKSAKHKLNRILSRNQAL